MALALSCLPPPLDAGPPDPGDAECPDGRITHIFVDNHAIFDVESLPEDDRLRWAYELTNTLHVRTRESFVARELPFAVGDCLDRAELREAARILREFRFIARADVFSVPQPDGNQHVVVDTRDEWTTKVAVAMGIEDGIRFHGASLTQENFLGRGVLVGAFWENRQEVRDVGGRLEIPRLFRTRLDARATVASTRTGSLVDQEFIVPFVGERAQVAARQAFRRNEGIFTYAVGSGAPYSHVMLPLLTEWAEGSVAARLGRPGNLTMVGLGVSRERLVPDARPDRIEGVMNGDFDELSEAGDGVADALGIQALHRGATRLNFLIGQRNIRYEERTGLDPVRGVQDIPLGAEATLTLGRSMSVLEPSAAEPADDLFGRITVFAGAASGPWVLQGHSSLEGRRIFSGGAFGPGWRDALTEIEILAYHRRGEEARHTLFGRISASGGWSVEMPYQLTLGGESAVRGFREDRYPGARRLIVSLEDRMTLSGPFPDLFDLGVTILGDVGRSWEGGVPFAHSPGWRGAVGAGLRVGFPSGTASVIRADLAFPVGAGGGGPVFRIAAGDILGIMGDPGSPQLDRSRITGVDTEFQGVAR